MTTKAKAWTAALATLAVILVVVVVLSVQAQNREHQANQDKIARLRFEMGCEAIEAAGSSSEYC